MSDKAILKLFQNRQTFFQYREYVKEHALLEETKWILKRYYDYFNGIAEEFDLEDFLTYVSNFNGVNEEKFKKIRDAMLAVESYNNDALEEEVIKSYRKQELAEILSEKVNEALDGGELDVAGLKEEINEYEADKELDDSIEICPMDIEELYARTQRRPGLTWSIPTINKSYGSLGAGDLVHVFGESNIGKTSFVVNECYHFLRQLSDDETILWINNEEAIEKVADRFLQRSLGRHVLVDDETLRQEAQMEMDSQGIDLSRILPIQTDATSTSTADYEEWVDKYNARVIVFNDLDKVVSKSDKDSQAHTLSAAYSWARSLAAMHHCSVISVGQAGTTAYGNYQLYKTDLHDSKVGKARECDLIIGLGGNPEDVEHRQVNLVKNKFGPENHVMCKFEPTTGRYVEEVPETYGY